jgi:hypothetical protein
MRTCAAKSRKAKAADRKATGNRIKNMQAEGWRGAHKCSASHLRRLALHLCDEANYSYIYYGLTTGREFRSPLENLRRGVKPQAF